MHPLLIDLIADSVLKQVRQNDLKACRGVCQKWNVLAIPFMRSSFPVSIYGNQNEEVYQHMREKRRVADFVELFKSNLFGIPFAKFRLGGFPMVDGVGKEFLQLCGETAKEFDLNFKRFESDVYDVEDVSELLKSSTHLKFIGLPKSIASRSCCTVKLFPASVPRLSSLKKVTFYDCEESRVKYCPTFFDELLTAAEKISDITIMGYGWTKRTGTQVLNVIKNRGMESSIESLKIHVGTPEHVSLLRTMSEKPRGLKLKKLSFCLDSDSVDAVTASTQLATIFKDTLEFLDLHWTACTSFTQFPRMANLKSLTFCVSDHFNSSIPVNLNDTFPTLQTLDLTFVRAHGDEVYANLFSQVECCTTLKSLNLFMYHAKMRTRTFDKILITFPNLTKLNLNVGGGEDDVYILRKVWTEMTQLEGLSVQGCLRNVENWDALFTGFRINAIKEIGDLGIVRELEEMNVSLRRKRIQELKNHYYQVPGIGNLTKLKRLEFCLREEIFGTSKIGLTDLTGYLAFHSLNQLIQLRVNASCEFTNTCCGILTADMELESWSFSTRNPELRSDIRRFPKYG